VAVVSGWGLRIRRPGLSEFNSATIVGRILGRITVSDDGSLSNSAFASGEPRAMVSGGVSQFNATPPPEVTFSGNTMSWTYPTPAPGTERPTVTIIYWVQ